MRCSYFTAGWVNQIPLNKLEKIGLEVAHRPTEFDPAGTLLAGPPSGQRPHANAQHVCCLGIMQRAATSL